MIQYETNNSPFYLENKGFCESIENLFKPRNIEFSGFCSSFGYDMDTNFHVNNLNYSIKFHKHQSRYTNYTGVEVTIEGLNTEINVIIDKSYVLRLFMSKKNKVKIPSPYYMRFNFTPDTNFITSITTLVRDHKISDFRLKNGKLICRIHSSLEVPLKLMEDIEKCLTNGNYPFPTHI